MCECIVHFLFLAHIIEKPFVSSERECKSYLFDVEVFLSFYFFFSLYLPLPLALLVDFLINDFSAQCPKERGNIPCIITLYATRWRENHKFPNVPEYPNSFSRRKNWILCFFLFFSLLLPYLPHSEYIAVSLTLFQSASVCCLCAGKPCEWWAGHIFSVILVFGMSASLCGWLDQFCWWDKR